MNPNLLQSLMMGFVSGLAELLPISADAHRAILRTLFGLESEEPWFRLLVHLACFISLIVCNRRELRRLQRANTLMKIPPRRRKHQPDSASVYTIRLLKTAGVLLVAGKLFTTQLAFLGRGLQYLAATLVLNGVLLLIPRLVQSGNKDSRNMPRIDGILMGLGAGLSVIPGISQVGATLSLGIARGVSREYALSFAYILMIPGLVLDMVFDLIAIAAVGFSGVTGMALIIALAGAVLAGGGSWFAQRIMKFLAYQAGYSGFSYYCWGAGLFCLILFLTV